MLPTATCPDPPLLEELVLGRLFGPEAEALEAHLATCSHCVATLQNLPGEDELVRSLRPPLRAEETPCGDLAQAVIPRLKQLRPPHAASTVDMATARMTASLAGAGEAISAEVAAVRFPFLSPAQEPDEIGRLGGFRMLGLLGTGGMGVVFGAEDPALKRIIALKVIKPGLVAAAGARARFLEEARALAALDHDHIVSIYQVGEDNGVPFLAMPLLHGETLDKRLKRSDAPLSVDTLLRVGREIAAGLAAAHGRGLVHRDIKPANIWIESAADAAEEPKAAAGGGAGDRDAAEPSTPPPRERVKILDFGLAQALCGDGAATPESRLIAGTPAYMAPEQARGEVIDGRADLFGLGCVLYQAATARAPFAPGDLVEMLARVAVDVPVPPRQLNPEVPPELDLLIVRLMEKKPQDRPESAGAVVEILQAIEESRRRLSRRRWLLGTSAAALAAAGLSAWGVHLWGPGKKPPPPGEVTVEYDEPDARIGLRLDDEAEKIVDAKGQNTLSLPPGDYALRPLAEVGKRFLWPARVLVKAAAKQTLAVQLVGEVKVHRTHSLPVRGVAIVARKDGLLVLSVSDDRTLVAWKPAGTDKPRALWHKESPLRCVALSSDGHTAATGSGDVGPRAVQLISFWDLDAMQRRDGGVTCNSQVNVLAYAPNGKQLLSAEHDGTLRLWDLKDEVVTAEQSKAHDALGVFAVVFLPGGERVLTGGGDGAIEERTTADLRPLRKLVGHEKKVHGIVVLPGAKQAVSAGFDGTIRVWDLNVGTHRSWSAPAPLHALAASPDGKRLLTGDHGQSGDKGGAVRLWDVTTQEEIVHFDGHSGGVTVVAFTPDGRRAVSGGSDGTVRLWELPKALK